MSLKSLIPVGGDPTVARRDFADMFTSLQREIDRLFEDFTTRWWAPAIQRSPGELVPRVDVTETDKEIEITAELPGLEDKDVQVDVADNVLIIKGEKKAEKDEKDRNYRVYERSYGSLYRALELPSGVDVDAIKASLSNGVLRVTVPKPASTKVKKVEVKTRV